MKGEAKKECFPIGSILLKGATHNDFIYFYWPALVTRETELCIVLAGHIAA